MEAVLFGVIMLAIPWLIAWTMVDHSKQPQVWWPFEMRSSKAPATPLSEEAETPRQRQHRRAAPTRPWKRSGF